MIRPLSLVLAAIFTVYYAFISPLFLYHYDIGWHLAAGDLIRSLRAIPETDPWSFTAGGVRWYNLSWAWDILASCLNQIGGLKLLLILTVLIGGVLILLLSEICELVKAPTAATAFTVLIAGIAFVTYSPPDVYLAIAPQVMTLVLGLTFLYICLSSQKLWALPFLMIAWCNLHGGFPLGLVIIGAFIVEAFLQRNQARAQILSTILLACLVATFVNPWGIYIYDGIARTIGHPVQTGVSEWQSLAERFSFPVSLPALLYIALFVVALARMLTSNRIILAPMLLSVALLAFAIMQQRYLPLFILLSVPFTAAGLPSASFEISKRFAGFAFIAAILAASLILSRTSAAFPDNLYPKQEIDYLETHLQGKRLLHHWNFGSFLIYQTRGRIPVFVDGRAGTAYPLSLFKNLSQFHKSLDWTALLDSYNIQAVMWPNDASQNLTFFARHPAWRLVFKGPIADIYFKKEED